MTTETTAARAVAIAMADVQVVRVGEGSGPRELLAGVNWTVRAGEQWVMLGANGAGKSTLLNLAGAVDRPTSGTVRLLGERIGRTDMRDLRERIGFVDARTTRDMRPRVTVLEAVLTGAFGSIALQRRRLTDAHAERARALLELVGADALADRHFATCSQGERQRTMIARALMTQPELLLLDEPTVGLDLPSRERLLAAVGALASEQRELPVITVTHHLEEIPGSCTHALLLRDGRVLAAGPVAETLTSALVSDCFELEIDVHRNGTRWAAVVAP